MTAASSVAVASVAPVEPVAYGPWARRYRALVDWPVGWRSMLVAGLLAPYLLGAFIAVRVAMRPETLPIEIGSFDRLLAGWFLATLVAFAVSFLATRGGREGNWTVYVLILLMSSSVAYMCWLFGSFSTLFMMLVPVLVIFASLIFEPRIGWIAFGLGILDWGGLSVLEMLGWLPYAPIVLDRSIDALVTPTWFVAQFVSILAMMGFVLIVSHIATNLRRAQQGELRVVNAELAHTRDRLQRGNDLVRRYVPAQLAARILGDDYEEPRRPVRKKLTIFFSELEGFAAASDQLAPEALSSLLNEYLSAMVEIAEAHGGTVNQFVGDGIMVLFGALEASDDRDHAVRAVRMALAMQERMAGMRASWLREGEGAANAFEIRVGINTGFVSVGNFGSEGRITYTAIGRETNLAARIGSACVPGRVLLSQATQELVRGEIDCVGRGEIHAKGIDAPVPVYEVSA